ncbi:carbonic anhydrase [Flavobacterium araucananum]|uniref:carbonic anhydrase n=1 Tax=Flavobacterium araucananum TaxID=946678 RepID=UPI000B7ADE83|nr:carbonic anhydrase family protein [Flavobacterium araucananum]PWK00857.1 carbonic anhydrase [Flavobacterium araucananum]
MKKEITKILLGFALITLMGCDNSKSDKKPVEPEKHWNYEGETGPEHWSEIDQNDCGGSAQSPIDIVETVTDETLKPIEFHYSPETKIHDVVNNGHSIQFDFEEGDYITLNGDKYNLKQFHFHEPAEHTIRGIRYPLVIHMVHMNSEGKYAVVAIMAKESKENSETFDFLDKYLPVKVNETIEVKDVFNLNNVLPENQTYYTYTGSLTTPPCTEGVQWYIFKNPVDVSLKMIEDLRKIMPVNNFRNVQQLNGRVIKESI